MSRTWRFTGSTALSFYAILVCANIFLIEGSLSFWVEQRLLMAAFFFLITVVLKRIVFFFELVWFGIVLIWVSFVSDPLTFSCFYIGIYAC